jgi:hypothetical protein
MSVGTIAQATRDGAVFIDAKSNDVLISTKTLGQRILMGFSPSNFPSTLSIGHSNVILGTPTSNITYRHWGDAYTMGNSTIDKNVTMSNAFILNKAGIGSNVNMIDPALTLYVDGTTRIQGDLIVNGNISAIDTDVTVTDEFNIINDGTGPALRVQQNGVTPIASFMQSNNERLLLTADGSVFIGSNVVPPVGPTDPLIRVNIQGGMFLQGNAFMSNITGSNATFDTFTVNNSMVVPDGYFTNLYMGNKLIIDATGVITNSNWIPTLDTSKVQYGTFTSNFIENYNVISSKLASNLTVAGTTFFAGRVGIETSNPTAENADIRLKVAWGDAMITGPSNMIETGHQSRLYFGPQHFIGASCNVGMFMQVANTTYPFVMEDNTGFVGLGVMDPEERLHIKDNAKINNRLFVGSNIAIGFSNSPQENLAIYGTMSISNYEGKVVMASSNNNLGINTLDPLAMVHVRNAIPGKDHLYIQSTTSVPCIVKHDGKVGIGTTTPSESLDVHQHAKVTSNMFVMGQLSVKNSNASYDLDVWGTGRVKQALYVDGSSLTGGAIYICNSNSIAENTNDGHWALDSRPFGTCNHLCISKYASPSNLVNISEQGFTKLGGSTGADERLHVSYGHVKIDSNLYVASSLGVGTSNPSEGLDIAPEKNAKFGSNVYIMSRLGIGKSNPDVALDVVGDIRLTGVLDQGAGDVSFGSNLFVKNYVGIGSSNFREAFQLMTGNANLGSNLYVANMVSINTSNPSERFDIVDGNAKIGSNVYIMSRLGVGTSNPQVIVEIRGTDAMLIPAGTTVERPSEPVLGHIRYNSVLQSFEGYGAGNTWGTLGGVKDTNLDTYISPESWPTSNDDTLRFVNSNVESMTLTMCNLTLRTETALFTRCNDLPMSVGINTNAPIGALDIVGNTRVTAGSFTMSNHGGHIVINTSNTRLGIQTPNPVSTVHINAKDAICIPVGTLGERPAEAIQGCIRYNTSYQTYEGYGAGNSWGSLGGVKDTNQDTYISAESFATSNDDIIRFYNSNQETLRIMPNGFMGVSNQAPSERLELNGGNAKFNSNVYVMSRIGIAASNPQVALEIQTTDSILIPKGSTAERPPVPVQGYIRYNTSYQTFEGFGAGYAWGSLGGVKDTNQDTYISAESFPTSNDDILRFHNNNQETMRIMPNGFVGVSNQAPSERLELNGGNAKFNSNVYVMSRVGVGLSNPLQMVHVNGNVRATAGTLGPMMILIPPIAYTDVSVGNRLVLDNTLEAGNDIASSTWKPLFLGEGFLFQDAGDEGMLWNQARLIFRGTALTDNDNEVTTMSIQEYLHSRTPQYINISEEFNISSKTQGRGYLTNATPWFTMPSIDVRHLAILISGSTSSSSYRFGSVYIQFRG